MSVQVVSAAATAKVPEVELKDLSPSEAEPQLGLSTSAVGAMVPPAGGGDPEAPAPAPVAERPPAPGPGSGPTAALSPAAGKVPQASAMKRSDPHHQHQRHRDGGEALVSPDGTVTEAPRTVKKLEAFSFITKQKTPHGTSLYFLSTNLCVPGTGPFLHTVTDAAYLGSNSKYCCFSSTRFKSPQIHTPYICKLFAS
ncbi:hypothetical protein STEG23_018430 [Scotinomys teguina]